MGRRPHLTKVYDSRDTRGRFASSDVHPVQPEPCPVPTCLYPDTGEHDCPATQEGYDEWVGKFAAVTPIEKEVASSSLMPPYLRLKQALENAALSGAAYRNYSERAMLLATIADLKDAYSAIVDMATERGHHL